MKLSNSFKKTFLKYTPMVVDILNFVTCSLIYLKCNSFLVSLFFYIANSTIIFTLINDDIESYINKINNKEDLIDIEDFDKYLSTTLPYSLSVILMSYFFVHLIYN